MKRPGAAAACAFLVVVASAGAAVFYVDSKGGSDSAGNGTTSAPFQTIGKAVSRAAASGDEVRIAGAFFEDVVFGNSKTVALSSWAPFTATLYGSFGIADLGEEASGSGAALSANGIRFRADADPMSDDNETSSVPSGDHGGASVFVADGVVVTAVSFVGCTFGGGGGSVEVRGEIAGTGVLFDRCTFDETAVQVAPPNCSTGASAVFRSCFFSGSSVVVAGAMPRSELLQTTASDTPFALSGDAVEVSGCSFTGAGVDIVGADAAVVTGCTFERIGQPLSSSSDRALSLQFSANEAPFLSALVSHNRFSAIVMTAVRGFAAVSVVGEFSGNVTLRSNDFGGVSHSEVAVQNTANGTVDATRNWWGTGTGPSAACFSGFGPRVIGFVDVRFWCLNLLCTSWADIRGDCGSAYEGGSSQGTPGSAKNWVYAIAVVGTLVGIIGVALVLQFACRPCFGRPRNSDDPEQQQQQARMVVYRQPASPHQYAIADPSARALRPQPPTPYSSVEATPMTGQQIRATAPRSLLPDTPSTSEQQQQRPKVPKLRLPK